MKRVAAVVDGFNFYRGLASHPNPDRLKWLDLNALIRHFAPPEDYVLIEVAYFSAYGTLDCEKECSHRAYVKALEATGVRPFLNHFNKKDKQCSSCGARIQIREEKESVFPIIKRLIELATGDHADLFMVVSGDTDLSPGLQLFRKLFPNKGLRVLFPPDRDNRSITEAVGGSSQVRCIEAKHLEAATLPEIIRDPAGRFVVRRPQLYSQSLPALALQFHLFGAATASGEALRQLAQVEVVGYSRNVSSAQGWMHRADLTDPNGFQPAGNPLAPAIWISFAPIWLFAPFLDHLATHHPERLHTLNGVIACSSSSAITKRFSTNRFDRRLVLRLTEAEDLLLFTCRRLSVPCQILRPTLIYGKVVTYSDRNLSRLLQLLRRLPVLPIPSHTGLRQPIHASQLAEVALYLARQLAGAGCEPALPERIALGGDTTLTYAEMLCALQQAQPLSDPARRCRLLPIPNSMFFMLAAPLLLRSPKAFESVFRMGADLSGFTTAHQLLGCAPQPFPVLPLA